MSALAALRSCTAVDHARVDDCYSRFDLAERAQYLLFLLAHARALPGLEQVIGTGADLPAYRPRAPLLADDLVALGETMPEPLAYAGAIGGGGHLWGLLYVVEGSRLGGGLLAQRVGKGLAAGYLNERHASGAWRTLGKLIDAEAAQHDDGWLNEAIKAAKACFAHFERAGLIVLDGNRLGGSLRYNAN